jgi:hypothetical protein
VVGREGEKQKAAEVPQHQWEWHLLEALTSSKNAAAQLQEKAVGL